MLTSDEVQERLSWIQSFDALDLGISNLFKWDQKTFNDHKNLCIECGLEKSSDIELSKAIAASVGIDIIKIIEDAISYESNPAPAPKRHRDPEPEPKLKLKPKSKPEPEPEPEPEHKHKRYSNITRMKSSEIREDQNERYNKFQKEELERIKREKELEKAKKEEELRKKELKPKKHIEKNKDYYLRQMKKMGPEPKDGLRIGFTFQDGKRLVRKFSKDTKGKALVTFISAQDSMYNEKEELIGFSLMQTLGPKLELNETLEEQGIKRSAMFSVVLDD